MGVNRVVVDSSETITNGRRRHPEPLDDLTPVPSSPIVRTDEQRKTARDLPSDPKRILPVLRYRNESAKKKKGSLRVSRRAAGFRWYGKLIHCLRYWKIIDYHFPQRFRRICGVLLCPLASLLRIARSARASSRASGCSQKGASLFDPTWLAQYGHTNLWISSNLSNI